MAIELTPATPAHAEATTRLHIACWQHNYRGLMDGAALDAIDGAKWLERRKYAWAQPERVKILAMEGNQLLGFCDGGATRDPRFAHCGEIYALYVRPECQGRKIGALLFAAAADALRTKGFTELMVKTLGTNPQSRAFYEKQGCILSPESASFEFGGKAYPEAIYLRKL